MFCTIIVHFNQIHCVGKFSKHHSFAVVSILFDLKTSTLTSLDIYVLKVLWRCCYSGGDRLGCGWKSLVVAVHRGGRMGDGRSNTHGVNVWFVFSIPLQSSPI